MNNFKTIFDKILSSSFAKKIICIVCIAVILISGTIIIKNIMYSNSKHASGTDFYFDTVVTIEIYDSDSSSSAKSLLDTCFTICETYDEMFDMYNEDSEIWAINHADGNHISVSSDTVGILNVSRYFSDITDGAYDVTIGSVSQLWDFTSESPSIPGEDEITDALESVNYESIILYTDVNEVLVKDSAARIDVGAIAKGYVSDKIKSYLETQGVTSAMINLGGNIELIGSKTDGTDFTIGVQKPFGEDDETIATVKLSDKAIVTSGIYQRYFEKDGTIYSHLLSTKTGYPIDNDLLSVTVIADSGIDSDGLSTSAMLSGLEDGIDIVEDYINAEAIFITSDYEIILTSGLEQNGDVITLK